MHPGENAKIYKKICHSLGSCFCKMQSSSVIWLQPALAHSHMLQAEDSPKGGAV